MRDLNQLRERGDEGTGRKLGVLAVAAIVAGAAVFAMSILVSGESEASSEDALDPLAQLDRAAGAEPPKAVAPDAPVEVVAADLSFPAALTTDPLVEAAVRAAAQEHAALERAHGASAPSAQAAPSLPLDAARARQAEGLPAGAAASGQAERLARVAHHDRLVAEALPTHAPSERAQVGHPGKFTLQVVSYQEESEAEAFAQGLRSRGHSSYVMAADVPGRGRYYRVRIGPFENRGEALRYQRSFETDERMHTLVVRNPDVD